MSCIKPFIFEFAGNTGNTVFTNPCIAVEGLAMFSTLMRDFSSFCSPVSFASANAPVWNAIISDYFTPNWIDRIDRTSGDVFEKFKEYCEMSDCTLIVAPEDDMLLYKLSKIADKHNNLGSSAESVKITSDKWVLYKRLKGKVDLPETSLRPLSVKHLIKPRTSCGGAGIKINTKNKNSNKSDCNCIYQEFIDGIDLSVSLVAGDDINVISINKQLLKDFEYAGAIVPFRLSMKELNEIISAAVETVSSLRIFGYCGIDIVYGDRAYVVDVNARLTTPAVTFKASYGINVGKIIINNFDGKLNLETKRCVCTKLLKTDRNVTGCEELVKYCDSKIVLEILHDKCIKVN
ncbi:MAG: ATP-utilizing protein [Archaeoglobus sp.]|nr:MAG: ATP-utilizing protein [Archaeoglobus sp.]